MPRAVRHVIPAAPIPVNPEREPELVAGTWHPLAYLSGLRFYSDSRRKQRLEVVGAWSESEVLLKDVSSSFCRTATPVWVQSMVDQYGLDENDEPLTEPVDWGRLMRAQVTTMPRPDAELLIEEAEQAERDRVALRGLMQGPSEEIEVNLLPVADDPWLPGFEDL